MTRKATTANVDPLARKNVDLRFLLCQTASAVAVGAPVLVVEK